MKRNQFTELKVAIAVGDDRAARGQTVLSTSDFLSRLKREAVENLRLGRSCKDEVTA